jgi:hypothetical protein
MTDALAVNTASGLEPNVKRQRVSLEVPPTEKVESIDENGVASLVRIAPREVRLNEKLGTEIRCGHIGGSQPRGVQNGPHAPADGTRGDAQAVLAAGSS